MLCKSNWILAGTLLWTAAAWTAPLKPLKAIKKADPVEQLHQEARSGNAGSAFSLAHAYLFGTPKIKANPVLGVYWLRRAADGGILDARYDLGMCLLNGWGGRIDRPAAWVNLNSAASSGHPAALAARELMRAEGVPAGRVDGVMVRAVRADPACAVSELLKAARSGNLYALAAAVKLRLDHPDQLTPLSGELLTLLAPHEKGNRPELLCMMGLLLREKGGEAARSAACLERAVKYGSPLAAVALGEAYERGDGVPFDLQKAVTLYQQGADNNIPAGWYHYALALLEGNGVREDIPRALELLKKASDAGYAEASSQLGILFEKGIGSDADPEKAFFFYDRARQLGSVSGMLHAARCLRDGTGTVPDPLKAALAWKQAAQKGSPEGMRFYALAMLNGFGIPRDPEGGLKELRRAAAAGDAQAAEMLKRRK